MTPVFGLETDESYAVETQKERYKEMKGKRSVSGPENDEMAKLREDLSGRVVQRTSSLLSTSDKQLLKEIKTALTKK